MTRPFICYNKVIMNAITIDDVKKLARLSALDVTDDEAKNLRDQLEEILGYFQQLDDVDTTGVEPSYQVTGLENVSRHDEVEPETVSPAELLKNAPHVQDGQIKVRRVL